MTDPARAVHHFMALTDGVAVRAYLTGRGSSIDPGPPQLLVWGLVADLFHIPAGAGASTRRDLSSTDLQEDSHVP